MKIVIGAGSVLVAFVLGVTMIAAGPGFGSPPSPAALEEIPPDLLPVYMAAAGTCPGLPWPVLAGIGSVESHHGQGRVDPNTGDVAPPIIGPPLDGTNGTMRIPDASMPDSWAHALGPMQFLSTTWATWGRLAPGRPTGMAADVHNAWDAIYSAAAYLCGGRAEIDNLEAAILTYNHSLAYVDAVLAKALEYGLGAGGIGVAVSVDGMFCPVAGPATFTNDWGDPRSDGRTHRGNDLFVPVGTPLVAVEDGVISQASHLDVGLGGISLRLLGDSGISYHYAHNVANAIIVDQRVSAGDVIAWVGNSGNASTTPPHVHFQLHPSGDDPVNPYPLISTLCAITSAVP